ncbi:MAG: MFS transporter [Alphaproteobacteria bacterium]|nr:MFS transporter [Alphaproteobacteria bacterium]
MANTTNAPGYTSAQTISVLTGASLMLTMSMGMRQSFGLFVSPVTQDLGISVADFTLAIAIQNFVWGLSQPIIGAFADRVGCRMMTILGSLLYGAGLGVTMIAEGPIALWIGLGVMVGLALACTGLSLALAASARAVSPIKRSVMLGTISAAGSIGTFIAAPLAQGLIDSHSWTMAMVGFLGLCVVMIPAAFFTGAGDKAELQMAKESTDSDTRMSLKEVLSEAWQHKGYVTMAVAYFVCGLQLIFIAAHLPAYLEICGQSPTLSAQALGVIGGFNAIGCYILGWMGGKYPKHVILGSVYILRSAFIVVYFLLPATPTTTLIFAAIMGLLWLGVAPLVTGLVGQIFGLRNMATLTGIAFFCHQTGSFVGAWGAGLLFDAMGNYDLAWQIGVLIGVTAGLCQLFMNDKPTSRMTGAVPA